jgi:hypothetical protein
MWFYGMPYISDAILFTKAFKVGFNRSGLFFDDGSGEPQYLGKQLENEFFCSENL